MDVDGRRLWELKDHAVQNEMHETRRRQSLASSIYSKAMSSCSISEKAAALNSLMALQSQDGSTGAGMKIHGLESTNEFDRLDRTLNQNAGQRGYQAPNYDPSSSDTGTPINDRQTLFQRMVEAGRNGLTDFSSFQGDAAQLDVDKHGFQLALGRLGQTVGAHVFASEAYPESKTPVQPGLPSPTAPPVASPQATLSAQPPSADSDRLRIAPSTPVQPVLSAQPSIASAAQPAPVVQSSAPVIHGYSDRGLAYPGSYSPIPRGPASQPAATRPPNAFDPEVVAAVQAKVKAGADAERVRSDAYWSKSTAPPGNPDYGKSLSPQELEQANNMHFKGDPSTDWAQRVADKVTAADAALRDRNAKLSTAPAGSPDAGRSLTPDDEAYINNHFFKPGPANYNWANPKGDSPVIRDGNALSELADPNSKPDNYSPPGKGR